MAAQKDSATYIHHAGLYNDAVTAWTPTQSGQFETSEDSGVNGPYTLDTGDGFKITLEGFATREQSGTGRRSILIKYDGQTSQLEYRRREGVIASARYFFKDPSSESVIEAHERHDPTHTGRRDPFVEFQDAFTRATGRSI